MRIRSVLIHVAQAALEGGLLALLVVGLVAGTAFAARGGGGKATTGGSLTLVMVSDDDGSGTPNWGEQVTFRVSTSYPYPVVSLTCSQGGGVVYGDSRPMYQPNAFNDPGIFTLSSLGWTGGPADCRAELRVQKKNGVVTAASLSFAVGS